MTYNEKLARLQGFFNKIPTFKDVVCRSEQVVINQLVTCWDFTLPTLEGQPNEVLDLLLSSQDN